MSDDGSEVEKPKEPEPPAQGKNIFLSHCNSYEGQALFKELWNKDQFEEKPEWMYGAHKFVGTVKKDEKNSRGGFEEPPKGIDSFVDFERTLEFRQKLLECDVIVYDLMSNSFEEVDYVIKTLKTTDLQEEKTLVLLSSVMTWVNTPPKFEEEKKEGEDDDGGDGEGEGGDDDSDPEPPSEEDDEAKGDGDGDDSQQGDPELDSKGDPIVIKEPIYFKESDYHLRVPHRDFQHLKTLETTAMSSVNTQPKLKVHVLCSGIRYGNGERIFYDHFQKAWIQNPLALPMIGEGDNLIPTIHVIDLARLVRRVVIEAPRVHPYIFAIDKTRKPTQKRLLTEISKGIGTGKIASVPAETVTDEQGWREFLSINLLMKTSEVFKAIPLTAEELETLEPEDQEKLQEERKFPWHTKTGIRKNVTKLNTEFNEFRGLNPVKIFITGPPASGKTFYADQLAKYYNIPKVHVKQLVAEVLRMAVIDEETAGENQLINDCRTKIEEERQKLEDAINEERDNQEAPEEGWPDIEIDLSTIRVPDELLYRVLKLKLKENDCRNRGYILDGFPRTFKDAQHIFLYKPVVLDENGDPIEDDDDDQDPDDENAEKNFDKYVKDDTIFPSSCIVLKGEDEELIKRVMERTQLALEGTHYNHDDMVRRLEAYRLANNSQVAEPAVQDFFKKQGIHFFEENVSTNSTDALNSFQIYIERNEKPFNFMTWDADAEVERRNAYEVVQMQKIIRQKEKMKQEENLEKILRKQKEQTLNVHTGALMDAQKDILDTSSQAIRQYLQDNLVIFLADGLHTICTKQPDDPVDSLAEYLFKRSLDVKYPDPTEY